MYRLGHLVDGKWVAHSHQAVFAVGERIVAGVPGGDPSVFGHMVGCLQPPYSLLYVLHTPGGEARPGRYQSPPLTLAQVDDFLARFGPFLSGDARFDLWAHSRSDKATLVWDRHNQLFGYGPIDRLSSKLASLGFVPGDPQVPAPHEHHYREELDALAAEVLTAFDWVHSPLRPEDEQ